jgi:hypothetical protein
VTRDRPRPAIGAVLALTRPEQQQRRQRAGRTDEVDRRRAGEVLHAEVRLQPAAAEHPVRADRVDHRGEDQRVDHVRRVLDALERRAPDDRQRDRAERELEQPLRLDRRVREAEAAREERLLRVAESLEQEAGRPDQVALARPRAEREGEAHRVVGDRGDREVGQDLGDPRARVLGPGEADLEQRESGLHEQDQERRHEHPHGVQRHRVAQHLVADRIEGIRIGDPRDGEQREQGERNQNRSGSPS